MVGKNTGTIFKNRALVLAMAIVLAAVAFCAMPLVAHAATGDTPPHSKSLTDNHDGTYTLSLDVVGDSEKKPNNINVIVIVDTSGSMTQQRMTAAKNAVNSLANALYAYNTQSSPDTVEMALVRFATSSSVARTPTNSLTQFRTAVNDLGNQGNGGTNWESALQTANGVDFGDNDQTFAIFVSDGNPTFRTTQNGWNDWSYQYQQWGTGQETNQNIQRCYTTAVDDAQALATRVTTGNFFTIGAFGNVDRMEQLTDDAGSDSSTNYYSAQNTAALNQAIADILAKIEMAGIGNTEIDDGTTNQVTTSSGGVAELLEVDTSSFKYYRSGGTYGTMQPWDDAPEAELVNGTVEWDLSSVGVLENGVRYTVTFDVYPSQYTYDTIAKLKNGDITYDSLDTEVKKYIKDAGNGNYTLLTNTNASLSWDDTRDDAGQQTDAYVNPDPVGTDAEQLTVKKEWEGAEPDVDSLPITVMMGDEEFHTATLSAANNWETSSFISVGIIKNGQVLPGALGHDFSFAELDDTQYRWELDAPTVRPMLVDGTLTMLIKVDADHPVPSGATTYTIDGNSYYVDSAAGGLTATNYRRSNLNLTKTVTGEDAPADATFPFTLTVNNSKAPATEPAGDTEHNSDYWVWFSIYDTNAGATVTDATVSGATGPNADGYYYAPSGTAISVQMKDGWNLRFTNLPSGTTYTFVEGDLADGFAFKSAELTSGTDSTFSGGQTTTGKIESTTTSYYVTYTNDYKLTDLEITKKWVDNKNQDGMRLTADALKAKLTLAPAVEGAEPSIVDNGDDTYTITYTGLPRFENGQEVTYTVAESEIDGYTTTGSPAEDHGTITNTHTPEVTKVTVVKVWDDSDDIGGIRPTSLSVQLTANGEDSGDPVTLNEDNEWTYTWENLPKYADGEAIEYAADEVSVPTGYTEEDPEVATDSDGNTTITITNTYSPTPVSVDPPVQKVINGKDDLYNKGDFTFTIENTAKPEGVTAAPMPENTSITNSATYELEGKTGFYEFGEIEFTMPGTYEYKITESGEVEGVTNDKDAETGKTLTFTVTDDGTGKLTVTPTTDQVQLSFTNVYDADGEASIVVSKEITGAAWPEGKSLTLTIAGADGAPMPEETTATLTAAGTVTFGPIAYGLTDAGKSYEYTITEGSFGAGWSGSPTSITATVVVTDNGDGTLDTTVTYDPSDAKFTNTYTATGKATIEVEKKLAGAEWPTGKTLTMTLAGTEAAPMPAAGGETVTLSAAGTATFGEIAYTEADAGKTYTYTISEGNGFGAGWTGSGDVIATVEVTDNGDGTLGTKVTYSPEGAAITNTYEAEGEAVIEVEKALSGAAWPAGKTLTLTLAGEGGTLPEAKTVELTAEGTATFGAITYDETDAGQTYTYTITEDGFGGAWTGSPASITATVVVTDKGDGTLDTTVTYSPEDKTFTNTYEASGSVSFPAKKVLEIPEGFSGPTDGSWTFTLTADEGVPMPETKEYTVGAGETVTFGSIAYDESDAGETYTYTVTETGTVPGVTNDATPAKTVTVEVKDNGDGTLTATPSSTDDNPLTFTNTYKADPTKAELKAGKLLEVASGNNAPDVSGKYDITITATGEAPLPDPATFKNADGEGTMTSFGEIEYTKPGEYQYTITESGTVPGVTNGTTSYTVKVKVTDKGDGTMEAEVTEGKAETLFTNTYSVEPTTATVEVNKTLTGTPLTAGAFEFTMTGADGAPMPENPKASNDADGKVAFDEITFKAPGTYIYTIAETNSALPGYTYDSNTVTATVTVTDNGDGTMTASVAYSPEAAEFVNAYKADGSVTLTAKKTLEGRTLEDGQFSFELLDEDGKVIETVQNNGSGQVAFSALKYDETIFDDEADEKDADKAADEKDADEKDADEKDADEKDATDDAAADKADANATDEGAVDDEVNANAADDTTTDEASATTDDATPTGDATTDDVAPAGDATGDANAQEPADEPTVTTQSTLPQAFADEVDDSKVFASEAGDAPMVSDKSADDKAADETDEPALKAEADETAADKRTKELKYTIREVNDGKAGYTYDGHEIAVTVTVTDNGDGKLIAEPEYSGSTEFINTYKATGEATFNATKAVTGATLEAGQFSFQLKSGNEVLQTKTNDASGAVAFDAIAYTEADAGKSIEYSIVEVNDGQAGYTYDSHVATATVTVTDNGDGTLSTEVKYSDGAAASFTNPYKPLATSAPFKAVKKLEGRDLTAGEFTFELADQGGAVVATATNAADGTVDFGYVGFDEPGSFTFTATEVKGDDSTITYDSSVKTYKVEVTDEAGQLVAKVTCDEGDAPAFTNKYTPKKTPPVPIPLPPTGDNLPIYALIAIALIAAVACIVAVRRRSLAVAKAERRASHSYYGRKH